MAGYIRNQRLQKKIERGELDAMPEVKEVDAECCGQHVVDDREYSCPLSSSGTAFAHWLR